MDIEAILAITFIFGVPSVALAAHLVLRPLVSDVVSAIRTTRDDRQQELEGRVERLENVIYDMDRQLSRLVEADRFRRQLEASQTEQRSGSEL